MKVKAILTAVLEAAVLLFFFAALMAVSVVYAHGQELACCLYDGPSLIASVVDDMGEPAWSQSVPLVIGQVWLGGTADWPMSVLPEGFRTGNLEITAWADHAQTISLATGELIPGELACVEYPSGGEVFSDGFESGTTVAWSVIVNFAGGS